MFLTFFYAKISIFVNLNSNSDCETRVIYAFYHIADVAAVWLFQDALAWYIKDEFVIYTRCQQIDFFKVS